MGYVWFAKKLKRCCVLFGTYKKRFVIRDPKSLNLIPAFWEHMGYVWFVKKLKRCCVLFGTYKKRFVIRCSELLNSIPDYSQHKILKSGYQLGTRNVG